MPPAPAMLVPVLLAALAAPAPALASPDYCRLSSKHSLCRYRGVAPECSHHSERRASPSPGTHATSQHLPYLNINNKYSGHEATQPSEGVRVRGVSEADIKEILDYHNRFATENIAAVLIILLHTFACLSSGS